MLKSLIKFSLENKFIVLLITAFIVVFGLYSLTQISIGAVPDITNNQVQVITTSRNLSTQDVEQYITYPVELEMSNLTGVKEIRSISKFGLSVVTIVFEDDLGTYLPRQLIAEKIESISNNIPEGFGTPQMGPISTGLGEIYQYILDVKPKFKDQYSVTDLRTIQDWIVKRQLSGIPGVVEINTWGGNLKQYEVAIDPSKLNALKVSLSELFVALENNNSIAGGGYIEKEDKTFFIRGEGSIKTLQDIENIVVKNDGFPVYVKDIAKVDYGRATRFGAITGNGEGEKVLGQVMMIKNGNAKSTIDLVRKRVSEIQKTLPDGVYINGFLDRSELIDRTTRTISENIILGALIVIFVVVLLLGNWRSGLVIASIIPISLLFAISLMNVFDIHANLMSLGAIDFGIIIDGAVIIVEFTAFQLFARTSELKGIATANLQRKIDQITLNSTTKMMNSAIFGQLIILIVFIPILSLKGVEGKMFTPMALTFGFALIGAMLLCLTYVPVVSSLLLKPSQSKKRNISYRFMNWINGLYSPVIHWALGHKKGVIGLSAGLLILSGFVFSKMGGEFVPTLDEGDFVIQPVLPTGMSLSKTIETTGKIERNLIHNFPEVEQVVTRIGAAEVPTDPMSMEETDIIIKLQPKREWVSARSKDALADQFKTSLTEEFQDMEIEFTQPIEMRFNELITGVRADVAIKIFGEDLSILAKKAEEVKRLIRDVKGASDITVEKIEGLPQMNVSYNRSKIARYGLNISEVNRMISMGFAGESVGSIFQGEKRFDLVIRLDEKNRQNINDLKYLLVDTPSGVKVPLNELAEVNYGMGPAKISRDNTKRRAVVGINVRDRDLQSVVNDVQEILDKKLNLPAGYTITYGGQFQNLNEAKSRLLIAVPIALFLIFTLLYFALGSIKEALIVYSAIPLAAVGGILFLWLRDMPFSISAGIGFIALFGIAVLNGIVLIEHFKGLSSKGMESLDSLIIKGATQRLRPVLLTASAAALGFLPMAISTSSGAEVQRPLATVVIGGLITATILTLVVLPVLYAWFYKSSLPKIKPKALMLCIGLVFSMTSQAQEKPLSLEELLEVALENNASIKASKLTLEKGKTSLKTVSLLDNTEIYYSYDQNNLALNDRPIGVFGIAQSIKFPTKFMAEKHVKQSELDIQSVQHKIKIEALRRAIYSAYYELNYREQSAQTYEYLDSLYSDFARKAKRKYELGETNYLEMITSQSKQRKIKLAFEQAKYEVDISREQLKQLVQIDVIPKTTLHEPLPKLELKTFSQDNNLGVAYMQSVLVHRKSKTKLARQNSLPDLTAEYFQGSNSGINQNLVGYQFGIKLPLLFSGQRAKIKENKLAENSFVEEKRAYQIRLQAKHTRLMKKLKQYQEALDYYNTHGKSLSEEILRTAHRSYKEGELDFFQFIQSIETAQEMRLEYLKNLNEYNQTIIELNYIIL